MTTGEMSKDIAVLVRGVGKRYHGYANLRDRLMHHFFPNRAERVEEVWALKDISFDIRKGESVAIIGRNGGGKSTLLQILTGTLTPTEGTVEVHGRVCALLELGSGFNPEYSGRDNVMMNGLLLGLSRQQILDRFDEIAAFAEIGDAIERPVKTYSSGMMLRLAFAVQVLADPDILIIDEALSVGDFFFQQKCLSFIRGLHESGVTLLFVSHDMGAVRDTCERGILLQKGRATFDGDNLEAIRRYLVGDEPPPTTALEELTQDTIAEEPSSSKGEPLSNALWTATFDASSKRDAYLCGVALTDAAGVATTSILMGQPAKVQVHYKAIQAGQYHIHLQMKNRANQIVTAVGSYNLRLEAPHLRQGEDMTFEFEIPLSIEAGEYTLLVSIVRPKGQSGDIIDETGWLGPISVNWDYSEIPPFYGLVGLGTTGRFQQVTGR